MEIQLRPIVDGDRSEMVIWAHEPPYDFYDCDPADDPQLLLHAKDHNLAAIDETGRVAGFVCFGTGGRVPGGLEAGAYEEPLLDIGLGLRPDLTGRGHGLEFVLTALEERRRMYHPQGFRLTVAAFNLRARRVYERAGFLSGVTVHSVSNGIFSEFLPMTLRDDESL